MTCQRRVVFPKLPLKRIKVAIVQDQARQTNKRHVQLRTSKSTDHEVAETDPTDQTNPYQRLGLLGKAPPSLQQAAD